MFVKPFGGSHRTFGMSYVHDSEKFFVIAHAIDIEPRELPPSTFGIPADFIPRSHDDQRPDLVAAAVVDARSFQVPTAQPYRADEVEIEALERVAWHGEFDDARAAVRGSNRFTIRRLREEGGTANLS